MLYMLLVKEDFFPRQERDFLTRKISYSVLKSYSFHSSSGAIEHGRHPKMRRTSGFNHTLCALCSISTYQ